MQQPSEGRITVVIADDDDLARAAYAELFSEDAGLEVVGLAADAPGTVETVTRTAPQVVLLDVRMPGGGGAAAARQMAELEYPPRIIAISAREDRDAVVEMLQAGAVGYLVKGGPIDEVLVAVRRAARGAATLSPRVTGSVIGALRALPREMDEVAPAIVDRVQRAVTGEGIEAVFQPIFDLGRRQAVGYEALARFHSEPQRGPMQWFAEANEVGLGTELELKAIEIALMASASIDGPAGLDMGFLAVNASPATVCDARFADVLGRDAGRHLVVEVTEHAAVDDYAAFRKAFEELRGQGVQLAVDDAGAGYASLRHVLQLDPDIIKLDMSITRDVDSDPARRAMATAMIAFARETQSKIVAEGIETERELRALDELGADLGQGFYLGRPEPAGAFQ